VRSGGGRCQANSAPPSAVDARTVGGRGADLRKPQGPAARVSPPRHKIRPPGRGPWLSIDEGTAIEPGVLFGLASAAGFGAGDFSGGFAARRAPAWVVAAGAQVVGLALLLVAVAVTRPAAPDAGTLGSGGLAGVFGGLALAALYAGLSLGSMGLVAALSGVGSVAIPAVVGALVLAQHLTGGQWLGVAAAAGAGLLASWTTTQGVNARAIQLAAIAAVGFGTWFVLLDVAAERHELWALVASRAAASVLVGGIALVLVRRGRTPARGHRAAVPFIALAGGLDVMGNAAFVLATTTVPVGIAAALSGLYPVVTMLLSWAVLRDRLPPVAVGAVVLAVGGTVLISIG
jgi:drug/metabolite transporter (DMT)-like permease